MQGSNFWKVYTVDTADDDPYRITLDDGSTMAIINSHVSLPIHALHVPSRSESGLYMRQCMLTNTGLSDYLM